MNNTATSDTIFHRDAFAELHAGDCRAVMDAMTACGDAPVHAVLTDPPYELGFMGKRWDKSGVAFDVRTWEAAFARLLPGGWLVAFGGTRTYHRMACAIEDAGFEIRDQIGWLYGSGFPKSLDVSKAIDREAGAEREVVGNTGRNPDRFIKYKEQDGCRRSPTNESVTTPATEAAKRWDGWGTALKPAWEPMVLARKPFPGSTVAQNVQRHGTGALHIDACRVPSEKLTGWCGGAGTGEGIWNTETCRLRKPGEPRPVNGRFPANVIHDGSDEVLAEFAKYGESTSSDQPRNNGEFKSVAKGRDLPHVTHGHSDTGSAARFFYCAKASGDERGDYNTHPTVKPLALMQYLVRLLLPPGGVVLDPFCGSGTTIKAANDLGFRAIGIDLDPAHLGIAQKRIARHTLGLGI